jgi:hypothetical protein
MSFNKSKEEGNALLKAGKINGACKKYAEALDFCADDDKNAAVCLGNRSFARLQQGQFLSSSAQKARASEYFSEALKDAEAAVSRDGTYAKAHYRKGKALEALGREKDASAALAMAQSLDKQIPGPPPVPQQNLKVVAPPMPPPASQTKTNLVDPSLNLPDEQKFKIFLSASQKNNVPVLQYILQQGMDPSRGNVVGQTALHIASMWGNVECCLELIESGADVDRQNTIGGSTPLHMAVSSTKNAEGTFQCMELLIAAGANCDLEDFAGRPPWKLTLDNDLRNLLGAPPVEEDSPEDIQNFPGVICRPCAPRISGGSGMKSVVGNQKGRRWF